MIKGTSLSHDSYVYTSKLGAKFMVEYIQSEPGVIRYFYYRIQNSQEEVQENTEINLGSTLFWVGFIAGGGGLAYSVLGNDDRLSLFMHQQ